jgi:hypothetical protein
MKACRYALCELINVLLTFFVWMGLYIKSRFGVGFASDPPVPLPIEKLIGAWQPAILSLAHRFQFLYANIYCNNSDEGYLHCNKNN